MESNKALIPVEALLWVQHYLLREFHLICSTVSYMNFQSLTQVLRKKEDKQVKKQGKHLHSFAYLSFSLHSSPPHVLVPTPYF